MRLIIILVMKEWKHAHKMKQIPHASGRMGATGNDSPRCRIFFILLSLLLHAEFVVVVVVVVVCMYFLGCCGCCMHVILSGGCVLLGLCVYGMSFFVS